MAPGRINSVPSGFMEGIKYAGEQQEVPLESKDLPRVFCVTELAVGQREPPEWMKTKGALWVPSQLWTSWS